MSFSERYLNIRWKTQYCDEGKACWCGVIVPENPKDIRDYVIGAGCIPMDIAKHIVEVHNLSISNESQ